MGVIRINMTTQKGFSLVEILLAILIAGLIVLFISNLPSSIKLIGVSKRQAIARDIITSEIEALRATGFSNLANGATNIVDPRISSLPQATATQTISDCPITICTSAEKTKQVELTINWQETNKQQRVSITTLISEGGLK
jgi:prepilin-type N-terminal cleavage/methylation domain-containing protein